LLKLAYSKSHRLEPKQLSKMLRMGNKSPSDPEAEGRAASSQVKSALLQFVVTVVVLQLAPVVLNKLGVVSE